MASTTPGSPALPRRAAQAGALAAGAVLLGAMSTLAAVEVLTRQDVFALPFVASAAVVAMAPRAPLARPAAVLIGYAASALIAVGITTAAGPSAVSATAAAVGSLVVMLLLTAPHAPAVVCAAFIGMTGPGVLHLLLAVGLAVLIVLGTALLAGRLVPHYGYPASWR
ncbi:HPP family protein [Micromonospora sp. NPDC000663]|uniref:HPP family protein n=1 Tax=Micromonospora sp. NPDC000663 TaxID=3364218 RepID=UPI00367F9CEE